MSNGYAGNILYVDLTKKTVKIEKMSPEMQKQYLGGCGFSTKLLLDNCPPHCDPLGVDNALIFSNGPMTGTLFPSSAMMNAAAKSPLTGFIIRSMVGGLIGGELKATGFDSIVIKGKAEVPVYLYIYNQNVEIRDASKYWGKKCFEMQMEMREDLGNEDLQIACIGPAGENKVRMASIISGTRAFGRGGLGAVMGSKKLKAITVYGTNTINVYNNEEFYEHALGVHKKMQEHPLAKNYSTYGSTASPPSYSAMGIFGTRNWQTETFDEVEKISGKYNIARGCHVRNRACRNCELRSSHTWRAVEGPYKGTLAEGPEFEALFSFGAMCGNNNFDSIVAAQRMCDEYGVDTITTGTTIAFAMECYEKGLLKSKDLDLINPVFGNSSAVTDLVKAIAERKDIGDLLAEGSWRASQVIGQSSDTFLSTVKGLEYAGHSARAHKGFALAYATSNRGGSHQDGAIGPERSGALDRCAIKGKGKFAKDTQDMNVIGDAMILCRRITVPLYGFYIKDAVADIINMVTGHNYTFDELTQVAERIYATERLFNTREGCKREHDILPKRTMTEPIPEGPCKGSFVSADELNTMLDEYYQCRGWDMQLACPTQTTLDKLDIDVDLAQIIKMNKSAGSR